MPLAPEAAMDESTRRVYGEVKQALGEPSAGLFYSALGAYPAFLQMHWKYFGPLARSRELLAAAERLRADAYTRAHNYFRVPDLHLRAPELKPGEAAAHDLTSKVDLYQYRAAVLLLLFTAQVQALDGPVGREGRPTPAEPPEFAREKQVETANGSQRRMLEEIRLALRVPYINTEYQALALWPEFLHAYWGVLRAVLRSPLYRESQYGVRETAWALARELPGPIEMSLDQLSEAGLTQEDIASVGRILELFVKNLGGLTLNMAVARIALEGGNQQLNHAAQTPAGKPGRAA